MIPVLVDYATPSAFHSDRENATLAFSANQRRPVRFHARVVENLLPLRMALQTLGELIWSDDTWLAKDDFVWGILDPVITVHPDRIFFEAFSQDQSVYGLVIADPATFQVDGEVSYGTTNVDFTAWLWAALGEMRSSRETHLHIGPEGFAVETVAAGGRFEGKVDVPESWVRGFLQLQESMAHPGTRLTVHPVDLLAAIRYLRYTKAKVSPRALRYEFTPGRDALLVLEPWETVIPLRGAEHNYTEPRTIRTWGRRRLRLIEPLLPFAESVDIYLKGRALPSFYSVQLPGVTFVLGLSGWTENRFTNSAPDLSAGKTDGKLLDAAHAVLAERKAISAPALAAALGVSNEIATRLLVRLCRNARAMYDVETRQYRHRELFETPIDEEKFYPPDPRADEARSFVDRGSIRIATVHPKETKKTKSLKTPEGKITREVTYREWQVIGEVAGQRQVEIVVNDGARIIFGTCGCAFFQENLLNLGPCAHMIALYDASESLRRDLPTSAPALKAAIVSSRRDEDTDEDEFGDEEGEEEEDG